MTIVGKKIDDETGFEVVIPDVDIDVDFRDSNEVWIWLGTDHRVQLMREDVFGILKSFLFMDAEETTREYIEKAAFEMKVALWEGFTEATDSF